MIDIRQVFIDGNLTAFPIEILRTSTGLLYAIIYDTEYTHGLFVVIFIAVVLSFISVFIRFVCFIFARIAVLLLKWCMITPVRDLDEMTYVKQVMSVSYFTVPTTYTSTYFVASPTFYCQASTCDQVDFL